MADALSPSHRSWLMSRVKAKNTTPEVIVRKMIRVLGHKFRTHAKRLPGNELRDLGPAEYGVDAKAGK